MLGPVEPVDRSGRGGRGLPPTTFPSLSSERLGLLGIGFPDGRGLGGTPSSA